MRRRARPTKMIPRMMPKIIQRISGVPGHSGKKKSKDVGDLTFRALADE